MRSLRIFIILAVVFCTACSPRDFLTRHLATDLIAGSDTFKTPQQFWLRLGIISQTDFTAPDYQVLVHHGWITGSKAACVGGVNPPPCWDVTLSPIGVDTFRDLMDKNAATSSYFSVPATSRELVEVTGISKNGNMAEVDFVWKWAPLNEVGAALYSEAVSYTATVAFKHYDDGWRILERTDGKGNQGLEDALKNSKAAQD